ncbi:MAG TPA: hypothetical protein VD968_08505 [Pyrinomonadaceae bacterium]|nr:hypothetical protein [Pyrinomonadaceae bacterium]
MTACALLFLAVFAARAGFFAWRGALTGGDTADYLLLASNIAEHGAFSLDTAEPFTPTIRRAPLYPLFLALAGGSTTVVILLQSALDAVVALLVLMLARLAGAPTRWAFAAGAAYAIHPGAIASASTILSEPLFAFTMTVSAALLSSGLARDRLPLTAAGGAAFAVASLCRPIAVFYPLAVVAAMPLLLRRQPRRGAHAAALVVCLAVVLAPWVVRSSALAGRFVLVQGLSAANFYMASRWDLNQQDEQQMYRKVFAPESGDPYGHALAEAKTPPELAATDRVAMREGVANIGRAPLSYLAMRARSVPYLFLTSFDRFTGLHSSFGSLRAGGRWGALALKAAMLVLFALLPFALALASLRRGFDNAAALVCACGWGYTLLIHLPMWIEYRFWSPVVPLLLVSAALGARRLTGAVLRR